MTNGISNPGWIRRHPILTGIFVLVALLMVFAVVNDDDTGPAIAAAIIILIVTAVILLSIAWVVDKVKGRTKSTPVSSQPSFAPMQPDPAYTYGTFPLPPTQPTPTPWASHQSPEQVAQQTAAEPDAPAGHSSFVETAHRPLPEVKKPSLITLSDMLAMSPTEFEEFCVKALEGIGYTDVKRVGGAGDLTADIFAVDNRGRSTVVQCKRYRPGSKVGSPSLQTFIGMKNVHHQADRGIYMTTADYSLPAMRLAKQHDIVLIDGDDLVKIAGLVMMPVRPQPSTPPTSRFCSSCGMEFPESARFCVGCGAARA